MPNESVKSSLTRHGTGWELNKKKNNKLYTHNGLHFVNCLLNF